jgi:hypothetical protein
MTIRMTTGMIIRMTIHMTIITIPIRKRIIR